MKESTKEITKYKKAALSSINAAFKVLCKYMHFIFFCNGFLLILEYIYMIIPVKCHAKY